jgi:hypothetical protein
MNINFKKCFDFRGITLEKALVPYTSNKVKDQKGNMVSIKVKVEISNDSLLIIRRSHNKK